MRGAVFYTVSTDCHAQHHTQVWSAGVREWRALSRALCSVSLCLRLCMCAGCLRKTQTPTWVLKTMHILISLIIHPYVTDERILVSVSGAGNVRGGGRAKGGKGALQSPNDCVPAGVWTSPCAQRRARWDTHQDSPLWCGEELGKWTFSEYRIIRESSAPRQPSKVWIPQDSRDTLTGSQSLPSH